MKSRGPLFVTLAGLLLWAAPARAQAPTPPPVEPPKPAASPPPPLSHPDDWTVGVDGTFGPFPMRGVNLVRAGLFGRFGYRYGLGTWFAVPEASLGFVEVAEAVSGQGFHSEQVWAGAGGRLGFRAWRLEPSVFAHGYVWFSREGDLALDGGAALDLRANPSLSFGVHFAWTMVHYKPVVTDGPSNTVQALSGSSGYVSNPLAKGEFADFGTIGIQVNLMR